jgi:hypothetical protein
MSQRHRHPACSQKKASEFKQCVDTKITCTCACDLMLRLHFSWSAANCTPPCNVIHKLTSYSCAACIRPL